MNIRKISIPVPIKIYKRPSNPSNYALPSPPPFFFIYANNECVCVSAVHIMHTFILCCLSFVAILLFHGASAGSIVVSTMIGGVSHTRWILEVCDILQQRGHNITFVSRDHQIHLAKPYLGFKRHSLGPSVIPADDRNLFLAFSKLSQAQVFAQARQFFNVALKKDYPLYIEYLKEQKPDAVICDALNEACIEATVTLRIPLVISCTFQLKSDSRAPYINAVGSKYWTTEEMTLWERFVTNYVQMSAFMYNLIPVMMRRNQIRKELGLPSNLDRTASWDNSLRIINSFFGLTPSQLLGPHTHLVGPIISNRYEPLTGDLLQFMNTHNRVVYVAFGSQFVPDDRGLVALLGGLLDAYEAGILDGVVWSSYLAVPPSDPLLQVCSSAQPLNCHRVYDMPMLSWFNALGWAPQRALLMHASTRLYVTHSGAESTHEAILSGKPMLCHPFKGDEIMYSTRVTEMGIALTHDREHVTRSLVRAQLHELLTDPTGYIASNVTRWKALASINGRRITHAADLIEEHMIGCIDGVPEHNALLTRRMSWLKANNVDLNLSVLAAVIVFIGALIKMTRSRARWLAIKRQTPNKHPIKKLQ
ncbi:hypothetical protein BC940DRAFT_291930 [Gongronella butleri]|nr:hypothetical protein BC940DRAFT_291930 [Gongronella butleri]